MTKLMTMRDVCIATGISYDTLKYYCNENLVPFHKRDHNNHRIFDARDLACVEGLVCLRRCGMSVKDMKQYIQLGLEGVGSISERKAMLKKTYEQLQNQQKEIEASLQFLEKKQNYYTDVQNGVVPYVSNLVAEKTS
ncbi:MerR family transcriptional regulator [Erysipelothrix sp. HDW6B]|uniref:MerR family transcriptional regulator n=1 Tax=Erysipelothrix sp. HDW6B TaxID=2714929 RepID=UPI001409BDED|nr:MerR family transcriptional regulator [Erysipelothrix sp. HDW6B]QIK85891.1 MerR family transcriptional regulator [Erysipelothrix sp. HDW6B]